MRVLMLNYEYPPLGGGAANATAHILREFAKRDDLDVDLVTSSTGKSRIEQLSPRITLHFVDIGKRGSLHYQTMRDLIAYAFRAGRYAKDLIKRGEYDLCHAFFGIPCGHIARKFRLPYVVSLRGSDVPFYNERFRWLDRLFFRRLSVEIWGNARVVVANSEGLRELALRTAPAQPIRVIPNGVDVETFRPAASKRTGGLRVLCVSRLIERKGIEYLLRAMAELRGAPCTLTLAGTGNLESHLRALCQTLGIGDAVRFLGFVPHEQIVPVYQEHDVFVLPSLNEGMSNTVLEAMACGMPVLMTNTGGASELIEDGANGYLFEARSPKAVADKLRRYLGDPSLAAAHGARARQIAERRSWSGVADAYRSLYTEVLSCAAS
jgi:L-malate glycosyltransferase